MKKIFAAFAVMLVMAGCTRPDDAKRVLEIAGYTDIQITGYSWFSCSGDDSMQTGFMATGLNGAKVKGVVCGGLFTKSQTIRID